MQDEQSGLFRISFDPDREKMIADFLQSVDNEPPTFLVPHYEYHKRLLPNASIQQSNGSNQMELCSDRETKAVQFNDEYWNETLEKVSTDDLLDMNKDTKITILRDFR